MDHEPHSTPRPPAWDRSTANRAATSGAARQLARNKGLAWVSAITLGAGAASTLGAVAIAVGLASPASTATTMASNTSTNTSRDDVGSQLQSATAPTTTNSAPVATSGGS